MDMATFFEKFEAFWQKLWEFFYTYCPWLNEIKNNQD